MSRFIETIRILNKRCCNLELHQERFDRTRAMFFPDSEAIDLASVIPLSEVPGKEVYKCRIVYDDMIREITLRRYKARKINHLKLVFDDTIAYAEKAEDRSRIDAHFDRRGDADDILIVRNGYLTDTSIANILLFDGNEWVTPMHPLLKGTQRQALLRDGKIREREIHVQDLEGFEKVMPVNAMQGFDLRRAIPVSDIRPAE